MADIPYNPTTEIIQESLDFIANLIIDCDGLEMLDYGKSYQVRRVTPPPPSLAAYFYYFRQILIII